jgi:hypothetical protein
MGYRRLARQTRRAPLHVMRQLYTPIALPKILYATDMWIQTLDKPDSAKKTSHSVSIVKKPMTTQTTAALAIMGTLLLPSNLCTNTLSDNHLFSPIIHKIA